jgi:hypothetical protein
MTTNNFQIQLDLQDIPHGHGLSFKRGISDGLLESTEHESLPHETHAASYRRGLAVGETLRQEIAKAVKP